MTSHASTAESTFDTPPIAKSASMFLSSEPSDCCGSNNQQSDTTLVPDWMKNLPEKGMSKKARGKMPETRHVNEPTSDLPIPAVSKTSLAQPDESAPMSAKKTLARDKDACGSIHEAQPSGSRLHKKQNKIEVVLYQRHLSRGSTFSSTSLAPKDNLQLPARGASSKLPTPECLVVKPARNQSRKKNVQRSTNSSTAEKTDFSGLVSVSSDKTHKSAAEKSAAEKSAAEHEKLSVDDLILDRKKTQLSDIPTVPQPPLSVYLASVQEDTIQEEDDSTSESWGSGLNQEETPDWLSRQQFNAQTDHYRDQIEQPGQMQEELVRPPAPNQDVVQALLREQAQPKSVIQFDPDIQQLGHAQRQLHSQRQFQIEQQRLTQQQTPDQQQTSDQQDNHESFPEFPLFPNLFELEGSRFSQSITGYEDPFSLADPPAGLTFSMMSHNQTQQSLVQNSRTRRSSQHFRQLSQNQMPDAPDYIGPPSYAPPSTSSQHVNLNSSLGLAQNVRRQSSYSHGLAGVGEAPRYTAPSGLYNGSFSWDQINPELQPSSPMISNVEPVQQANPSSKSARQHKKRNSRQSTKDSATDACPSTNSKPKRQRRTYSQDGLVNETPRGRDRMLPAGSMHMETSMPLASMPEFARLMGTPVHLPDLSQVNSQFSPSRLDQTLPQFSSALNNYSQLPPTPPTPTPSGQSRMQRAGAAAGPARPRSHTTESIMQLMQNTPVSLPTLASLPRGDGSTSKKGRSKKEKLKEMAGTLSHTLGSAASASEYQAASRADTPSPRKSRTPEEGLGHDPNQEAFSQPQPEDVFGYGVPPQPAMTMGGMGASGSARRHNHLSQQHSNTPAFEPLFSYSVPPPPSLGIPGGSSGPSRQNQHGGGMCMGMGIYTPVPESLLGWTDSPPPPWAMDPAQLPAGSIFLNNHYGAREEDGEGEEVEPEERQPSVD
ncbi:hypothetical protein B0T17DRAFT_311479 [Bombardia bombarda]|uniref:Uncharacterized protein n=1 Tax=Bombardia bombarda TaxID=252184 RepID=A0AA39WM02_9PEZI|nr:hypothetical protein B0T17DRAFT_311479 [Bombardia bombarda]